MASLIDDGGNLWRVQYTPADGGKRQTLRTGNMKPREAQRFADKVEALVSAKRQGRPIDDSTAAWVDELTGTLRQRLEAKGLVKPQAKPGEMKLGPALDKWIETMSVKPASLIFYGQVRRDLLAFFGKDRDIATIGPEQADEWRTWYTQKTIGRTGRPLSVATISRRVVACRHFFKTLVRWKMVIENPFAEVKTGSQKNKSRAYFITREMTDKVFAECPDAEWRLIVALSRYGGLRCPSEHVLLRWQDINWEKGRILIHSPKTEQYAGQETRWLPLFPELKPFLMECFEQAAEGAEYVIVKRRSAKVNLRTQLQRIITRAGLTPWPRLFHNLRATRQTELTEDFPSHVVSEWLGNSEDVAADHYLQVTDQHFERAAAAPAQAAHNAAQRDLETVQKAVQVATPTNAKTTVLPVVAPVCTSSQSVKVFPRGLEPLTFGFGGRRSIQLSYENVHEARCLPPVRNDIAQSRWRPFCAAAWQPPSKATAINPAHAVPPPGE